MAHQKTNSIKKAISWIIAIPALVIVMSDITNLALWWIQFAAIAALAALLGWNGMFPAIKEEISNWRGVYK